MKKKYFSIWMALGLALLCFIPLLNVAVFAPGSLYYSLKGRNLAKKDPKQFGGYLISHGIMVFAMVAWILSFASFWVLSTNFLFSLAWSIFSTGMLLLAIVQGFKSTA